MYLIFARSLVLEPFLQPDPRHRPVALHGAKRDSKKRRDVIGRHSSEELQFHHLSLPRTQLGEFNKTVVKGFDIDVRAGCFDHRRVKGQPFGATTSLVAVPGFSVVEQHLADDLGREIEKMSAILDGKARRLGDAVVCLVNHGCRLERMPFSFVEHHLPGDPAELRVQSGEKLIERGTITGVDPSDQGANRRPVKCFAQLASLPDGAANRITIEMIGRGWCGGLIVKEHEG